VAPCAQRPEVWLAPTARVPCSNAANIGECKTWRTQVNFAPGKIPLRGNSRRKCINSLPVQETAKTSCKVWLASVERRRCINEAKTRNPLKFAGMLQTRQQISAISRPKFTILSGHVEEVLLFNIFFPLSIHVLVAKIWPDKIVRCADMATFCVLYFQRAACSTFQTCILNSH